MVNHASGGEDPRRGGLPSDPSDVRVLEQALRQAISTSPEAFLKTMEDIENRAPDYWQKEIDSATWVVIENDEGDPVGVAAARVPDLEMDSGINRPDTRFIDSVWVAPSFRGRGLGERLLRFLFETESSKSPDVRQFYLWVLERNILAITLYERMGFTFVEEQVLPDMSGRTEFRYEYLLDPDQPKIATNAAERHDDLKGGLTYRVLGRRETA